jgi:glycosyltransferase involved in cell wall biosynthesis
MNVGGTARYVGELVENIPGSLLATGFVQGSEIEDPCVRRLTTIRLSSLGRRIDPVNDYRAWVALRRIIKREKPDIVHTHTFKAGLIGRLVSGSHKRVHTFHGHLFGDHSFSWIQMKFITFIERILARRTDLLISVGDKVGIELRDAGIGPHRKWKSIAPGVDALPKFEKEAARKLLGIQSEQLIFGWMARVTKVKNPFLLLEIAKKLPNVNFVMAGGGDLLHSIKLNQVKNLSIIGWADASQFWSAVDCAISTSDNEGMPIALIEAQLAGIPVIASDVGSNCEVIQNEITGYICDKNIDDFVFAIKRLYTDDTLRSLMGDTAKIWAREEFSIKKMIDAHTNAYLNLIRS